MRRNDDLFRKLNKEKPLIKQREIQPLSTRDFNPRTAYDLQVEKRREEEKETTRGRSAASRKREASEESVKAGRHRGAKSLEMPQSFEEEREPVRRKSAPEVFPGNAKPQTGNTGYKVQQMDNYSSISEVAAVSEKVLSFRHELKFYINYRDYVLLRSALKSLLSPDPFADENNSYHIRSLYFDDIYDSALREKIAGSDERKKYRIRIYNFNDNVIKFEKKIKKGQYVAKKSILLSRDEYERLIAGDYDFLKDRKEELAKEIYLEMRNNLLRPRVLVDYTREAYVSPIEDCRITFDKDLKGSMMMGDMFDMHAPVMPMYESGMMVLEVKFNKFLPEYVRRIINNLNAAERCAISKYVISRKFD